MTTVDAPAKPKTDSFWPRSFTAVVLGTWVYVGCVYWLPAMVALLAAAAITLAFEIVRAHSNPPTSVELTKGDNSVAIAVAGFLVLSHIGIPLLFSNRHPLVVYIVELLLFVLTLGYIQIEIASPATTDHFWLVLRAGWMALPLAWLITLLLLPNGSSYLFDYAALIVSSDVGGYICGRTIRKVPLPEFLLWLKAKPAKYLSPNKTIFGFMGAMVLGPAVTATIFVRTGQPYQSWLIALAILLGILGQAGDLYMSSLKRAFGIKDFAKKIFGILPGMGGIGDRVDSVLLTAPVWCFVIIFSPLVIT